jgi:hypothetical protein
MNGYQIRPPTPDRNYVHEYGNAMLYYKFSSIMLFMHFAFSRYHHHSHIQPTARPWAQVSYSSR